MKSGHTKRPFSLPLVPTRAALSTAHGRTPGAVTYWDQAYPEGPNESNNCQQSGSDN